MNKDSFSNYTETLLQFGDTLGIAPQIWIEREELRQIAYIEENLKRDKAIALTLEQLRSLVTIFNNAISCRFLLEDLPVLDVTSKITQEDLNQFRGKIKSSPSIRFQLLLDKTKLIQQRFSENHDWTLYLYIFHKALEKSLDNQLKQLEDHFWGDDKINKIIIIAADKEILMNGPYFVIIGGNLVNRTYIDEIQSKSESESDKTICPEEMYKICRENLKWQESWLKRLTPLHLEITEADSFNDPITLLLNRHLVDIILLYTAERSSSNGRQMVCSYIDGKQCVDLTLRESYGSLNGQFYENVKNLMKILKWAYEPRWASERLQFLQSAISQSLYAAEPSFRYKLLIYNATNVFNTLQWHWKAFIDKKVSEYSGEVQALENCISDTVQGFSDRIASMTKNLIETALATVAAFIGSFIAAILKDGFNPIIFKMSMLIYGGYVLIFPFIINLFSNIGSYNKLLEDFEVRYKRFEERLYPDKVKEIVGDRIENSKKRFRRWRIGIIISYTIIVLLIVSASIWLAPIIGQSQSKTGSKTSSTQTVTPSPISPPSTIPKPS